MLKIQKGKEKILSYIKKYEDLIGKDTIKDLRMKLDIFESSFSKEENENNVFLIETKSLVFTATSQTNSLIQLPNNSFFGNFLIYKGKKGYVDDEIISKELLSVIFSDEFKEFRKGNAENISIHMNGMKVFHKSMNSIEIQEMLSNIKFNKPFFYDTSYYFDNEFVSIEDYITKNIKQKRRSGYRKIVKLYDNENYQHYTKETISLEKGLEMLKWIYKNQSIREFKGSFNYWALYNYEKVFYETFKEFYNNKDTEIHLLTYEVDGKLEGCELMLEGPGDDLFAWVGYENTEEFDGLGKFLILKEIEYMSKNKNINILDYSSGDPGYKKAMGMKQEKVINFHCGAFREESLKEVRKRMK